MAGTTREISSAMDENHDEYVPMHTIRVITRLA